MPSLQLSQAIVLGLGAQTLVNKNLGGEGDTEKELTSGETWMFSCIVLLLTCMAGFMSGLTIGLASIDKLDLEIKLAIGSEAEKKSARVISKVVHHHHWMLCTLLLCNAIAMEGLPLCLD
jgi:hypothetical protein